MRDLEALRAVFVAREGRLLGALAAKMAGAKGGEAVFEVWMKRESDLVQVSSGSGGGRGMRVESTGSKGEGQEGQHLLLRWTLTCCCGTRLVQVRPKELKTDPQDQDQGPPGCL